MGTHGTPPVSEGDWYESIKDFGIDVASGPPRKVPKTYAAGLEIRCPGGALSQTGPCNPQPGITSN